MVCAAPPGYRSPAGPALSGCRSTGGRFRSKRGPKRLAAPLLVPAVAGRDAAVRHSTFILVGDGTKIGLSRAVKDFGTFGGSPPAGRIEECLGRRAVVGQQNCRVWQRRQPCPGVSPAELRHIPDRKRWRSGRTPGPSVYPCCAARRCATPPPEPRVPPARSGFGGPSRRRPRRAHRLPDRARFTTVTPGRIRSMSAVPR